MVDGKCPNWGGFIRRERREKEFAVYVFFAISVVKFSFHRQHIQLYIARNLAGSILNLGFAADMKAPFQNRGEVANFRAAAANENCPLPSKRGT